MVRHPSLGRLHRNFFPLLQILKNRQGRKRLARVAFHADHFRRHFDNRLLSSLRIRSLTSAPTGGRVSRLTKALFSPRFSVVPSTFTLFPLCSSVHIACTGIWANIRWCIGVLYDDVAYSICAIYSALFRLFTPFLNPFSFLPPRKRTTKLNHSYKKVKFPQNNLIKAPQSFVKPIRPGPSRLVMPRIMGSLPLKWVRSVFANTFARKLLDRAQTRAVNAQFTLAIYSAESDHFRSRFAIFYGIRFACLISALKLLANLEILDTRAALNPILGNGV
jgi:hypothetical protein